MIIKMITELDYSSQIHSAMQNFMNSGLETLASKILTSSQFERENLGLHTFSNGERYVCRLGSIPDFGSAIMKVHVSHPEYALTPLSELFLFSQAQSNRPTLSVPRYTFLVSKRISDKVSVYGIVEEDFSQAGQLDITPLSNLDRIGSEEPMFNNPDEFKKGVSEYMRNLKLLLAGINLGSLSRDSEEYLRKTGLIVHRGEHFEGVRFADADQFSEYLIVGETQLLYAGKLAQLQKDFSLTL